MVAHRPRRKHITHNNNARYIFMNVHIETPMQNKVKRMVNISHRLGHTIYQNIIIIQTEQQQQ